MSGETVFICLDFTNLSLPECKGFDDPSGYYSDYEKWSMQ